MGWYDVTTFSVESFKKSFQRSKLKEVCSFVMSHAYNYVCGLGLKSLAYIINVHINITSVAFIQTDHEQHV